MTKYYLIFKFKGEEFNNEFSGGQECIDIDNIILLNDRTIRCSCEILVIFHTRWHSAERTSDHLHW